MNEWTWASPAALFAWGCRRLGLDPGAALVGLSYAACLGLMLWLGLGVVHAVLAALFAALPAMVLLAMLFGGGHAFASWLCGRWWGEPQHAWQHCVSFALSLLGVLLVAALMNVGGFGDAPGWRGA